MSVTQDRPKEFYRHDVVYRLDRRKRVIYGMVTESYEASTDDYYLPALQRGQIRVLWNNKSRDQVCNQNKVRLVCRSVIPGDVVRRFVKDKETQRGYCKDIKLTATVQIVGTDRIIEHVNCDRLHPVRNLNVDDFVCMGKQYGRIESTDYLITMQSKCGSIVELLSSINTEVEDYWLSKRNRTSLDPFYPGQEVIATPSNFEQPKWIKKTKVMKRNMLYRQRFTIQSVNCTLVEVLWNSNKNHITELKPEQIKRLKVMPDPNYVPELVERRLLKLNSSDMLINKKDWLKKQYIMYRPEPAKVRHVVSNSKTLARISKLRNLPRVHSCIEPNEVEDDWWTEEGEESEDDNGSSSSSSKLQKRHFPPKPTELVPGNTLAVEVLSLESKISVVWQDGTDEKDIPSVQLDYSISLDDHEFFPGEWVVSESLQLPKKTDFGTIQNVKHLERTALVKWFRYSEADAAPVEVSLVEESVYDLKKHPKYAFRPGSVVKEKPDTENRMGKVIDSYPQGSVLVRWMDGTDEECPPTKLELMPDSLDELDDSGESDESEDEAAGSWETESIESYTGDVNDETTLQNLAAKLHFIRGRLVFLREAFASGVVEYNFSFLKDLLLIFDNSSYLDKLLNTCLFSVKSKHFQMLLTQAKEKAKEQGVELRGRLFSNETSVPSAAKMKTFEKENISKIIKLENKVNAQLGSKSSTEASTPMTPCGQYTPLMPSRDDGINLCVELITMLKARMDLSYAEIMSRLGSQQALTVMTLAQNEASLNSPSVPVPGTPGSVPPTPEEAFEVLGPFEELTVLEEAYAVIDEAPSSHKYFSVQFEPMDQQKFLKTIQTEYKRIAESMPSGIWVRSYSNRLDLLSLMIRGPENTPYSDGLFCFDLQLSKDYPRSPPIVHYISYSFERLNPNLYVEGKVCVSLLGTWMGRGTEVWGPNSTLLQLIVSIQGLILVPEPYYNEAGYEKQASTQQGYENSRTYNELVILRLVQSMTQMILSPPEIFRKEVLRHFQANGERLCDRLESYCRDNDPVKPEFPLHPVSKGLKLSLEEALKGFRKVLGTVEARLESGVDNKGIEEPLNVRIDKELDRISEAGGFQLPGQAHEENKEDMEMIGDRSGSEKIMTSKNEVDGKSENDKDGIPLNKIVETVLN